MILRFVFSLLALAALVLTALGAVPAQRNMLGVVVGACRLNAAMSASPAPCLSVVEHEKDGGGYAVLREPLDRQRTVLAALDDVTGIEDPRLLASDAPNFFASAWKEQAAVISGDFWQGFAVAINPTKARSQDRLHVHMACFDPQALDALEKQGDAVNPNRFAALNFKIGKQALWAMRVTADDMAAFNPIRILADRMPGARDNMGGHLLIVVSERLPDGRKSFVLLTNKPEPKQWLFSVERFLDPACS